MNRRQALEQTAAWAAAHRTEVDAIMAADDAIRAGLGHPAGIGKTEPTNEPAPLLTGIFARFGLEPHCPGCGRTPGAGCGCPPVQEQPYDAWDAFGADVPEAACHECGYPLDEHGYCGC